MKSLFITLKLKRKGTRAKTEMLQRIPHYFGPAINILVGIVPLEVKIAETAEPYKVMKATHTLHARRQAKNLALQNMMKKWRKTL